MFASGRLFDDLTFESAACRDSDDRSLVAGRRKYLQHGADVRLERIDTGRGVGPTSQTSPSVPRYIPLPYPIRKN